MATRNINDATGLTFAAVRPDVLVSAFFNQRIGEDLLRLPSIAAVNVHTSLLPDYKGVDPVFFARLNGAPRLGVTVRHLERDLDAGRVLVQQTLTVSAGESVLRTTARLFALGGCLLASRLALPLTRQSGAVQSGCGHYDSWPSAAEVARLRGRGIALVRACDLAWARRLGAGDGAGAG